MDVLLHRLCLTRSRSEAKAACEAGAVLLDGKPARPSDAVPPGRRIEVRYPSRTLEVELLATEYNASASSFPTPSISAPDDWAFARDNREDRARLLALCVSCAVAGALAGGAFLMFLR